jgi:hypothetical protein
MPLTMPKVRWGNAARERGFTDFAVRPNVNGATAAGLVTRGLRGFFVERMANFTALAPARIANRAMALNER